MLIKSGRRVATIVCQDKKMNEACGLFGIFSNENESVADTSYYALFALQHRGQQACGIVVNDDGLFTAYKDAGIVNDVFNRKILDSLGTGNMAMGHVLYGSEKGKDRENAQPVVVNHHKGRMAVAINGELVNGAELKKELELKGSIFHTTSDAEIIAHVITRARLQSDSIEEAISKTIDKLEGAYSMIVMSPSKLIGVRDPHGFHPLCYGKRDNGAYVLSSESCAINSVNAEFVRELEPGEILIFEKNGVRSDISHTKRETSALCIFEYIYFARPDSVIQGVSVHEARMRSGASLAKDFPVDADVVIGVPDSGTSAAIGYAVESGIPYGVGFIKNKYIGRTFIAPGQKSREDLVKIKLNVVKETVRGKKVVLVDDSIVRGTTITRIINLLREAGATEVHVRSAAPPFKYPCYYGVDVADQESLIACQYKEEDICGVIGADSLGYFDMNKLDVLIEGGSVDGFCYSCFTGKYPTRVPEEETISKYDKKISE